MIHIEIHGLNESESKKILSIVNNAMMHASRDDETTTDILSDNPVFYKSKTSMPFLRIYHDIGSGIGHVIESLKIYDVRIDVALITIEKFFPCGEMRP